MIANSLASWFPGPLFIPLVSHDQSPVKEVSLLIQHTSFTALSKQLSNGSSIHSLFLSPHLILDEVKRDIAESTADMHLLGIVSLLSSSTQSEDEELVRTASELLVLVLTGGKLNTIFSQLIAVWLLSGRELGSQPWAPGLVSGSQRGHIVKTKARLTMQWSIDTDPLMVLHAS